MTGPKLDKVCQVSLCRPPRAFSPAAARGTFWPSTAVTVSNAKSTSACRPYALAFSTSVKWPVARAPRRTRIAPSTTKSSTTSNWTVRSEEHTSELQSLRHLVCRLLLEKKENKQNCDVHRNATLRRPRSRHGEHGR